jgi:hypothetical protein
MLCDKNEKVGQFGQASDRRKGSKNAKKKKKKDLGRETNVHKHSLARHIRSLPLVADMTK